MKTILTTLLLFGMAGAHGELFKATGYQKYYTHVTSSAVGDVNRVLEGSAERSIQRRELVVGDM